MLASETAGTPFGKRAVCSFYFVPAAVSITEPSISTLLPYIETFGDAEIVVALGPLPIEYTCMSYKLRPTK